MKIPKMCFWEFPEVRSVQYRHRLTIDLVLENAKNKDSQYAETSIEGPNWFPHGGNFLLTQNASLLVDLIVKWYFPLVGRLPYTPQHTIILIVATPIMVPLILGTPPANTASREDTRRRPYSYP